MNEVPFEPDVPCQSCGKLGSWDFMGDSLCVVCASEGKSPKELETRARKAFVPKGHPEKDFQDTVMALLRTLGFDWVRHSRPGMTSRTVNGKAVWTTAFEGDADVDILAIRKRDKRGLAWELKAGKNKATPDQEACLKAYESVGWHTGVYYPEDFDTLKNILEEWQ